MPFLSVFFFCDTYDLNVGAFNIVPGASEIVLTSFNSFFFGKTNFHHKPNKYRSWVKYKQIYVTGISTSDVMYTLVERCVTKLAHNGTENFIWPLSLKGVDDNAP